MSDDLDARLRRALSDAGDAFEPATPLAEMRETVSRRVRRRQRLQGLAVVVLAIALLTGGLTTWLTRSSGSTVASLATSADGGVGGHAGIGTQSHERGVNGSSRLPSRAG